MTWIVEYTFCVAGQKASLEQRLRVEIQTSGSLHRPGGHPPHAQTVRPEVKLLKHLLSSYRRRVASSTFALFSRSPLLDCDSTFQRPSHLLSRRDPLRHVRQFLRRLRDGVIPICHHAIAPHKSKQIASLQREASHGNPLHRSYARTDIRQTRLVSSAIRLYDDRFARVRSARRPFTWPCSSSAPTGPFCAAGPSLTTWPLTA